MLPSTRSLSSFSRQTSSLRLYTLEGSDVGTLSEMHPIWLGLYLYAIVYLISRAESSNNTLRATVETRLYWAGFERGWSDMSSLDGLNLAQAQTRAFPRHGQQAYGAGHSPLRPLCETAIGNQSHGDTEAPGHGLDSPRSASATTKPNRDTHEL